MKEYWFVLNVNPTPWTAPTVSIGRKGGKPYPMVYSSEELKNYKQAVEYEAAKEIERKYENFAPIEDEIALHFFFYRKVEQLHRGKSTRTGNYADATNLQKATEDGLQGTLFVNDSQVVDVRSTIVEQSTEVENPCVVVRMIWHPDRPKVPDDLIDDMKIDHQKRIDELVEANEHDVPEGIF